MRKTAQTFTIAGYDVFVFHGSEHLGTQRIMPDGGSLDPDALYWEPLDYEMDVIFSGPFTCMSDLRLSVQDWARDLTLNTKTANDS